VGAEGRQDGSGRLGARGGDQAEYPAGAVSQLSSLLRDRETRLENLPPCSCRPSPLCTCVCEPHTHFVVSPCFCGWIEEAWSSWASPEGGSPANR
jgi:hypothetical protein